LIELGAVRLVCGRYAGPPAPETWRERANFDTQPAFASGRCWIIGRADFSGPLTSEQRAAAEALGVQMPSGSVDTTSAVVPRDALPAFMALPFVRSFDIEPPATLDVYE
jgi:hypothetical protein